MSIEVEAFEDERDRRVAGDATGPLSLFNRAGVLEAADVHVAQRVGRLGAETDQTVLLAVALAVRAVRSGSVCVDLATVGSLASELEWPSYDAWVAALEASSLVASGVLHLETGGSGALLYLDRYWGEEQQVVTDLGTRSAAAGPAVDETVLAAALLSYFPKDEYADQRLAAETASRHWTSVVTGGPGTGKTTTVARLLGVLMSVHGASEDPGRPLRVALAAPTGKAAARMVQAVRDATHKESFPGHAGADAAADLATAIRGLQASTLHRLLGWTPNSTRFKHDRGNRLPHDVVVVDESSMVSLTMMARLLEAIRPSARLVLVGDADQLASVDAGAVLKDLVDGYGTASGSPVVALSTSRRFGEQIGALAEAVRAGDVDAVMAKLAQGSTEVIWLDRRELHELIAARALSLRDASESSDAALALAELDRHRLLCAHREGPYGVAEWNRIIERLLMERTGRDWLPEWYAGRPFMVNTNDYGLNLWNGDTGVVCRSGQDLAAVIGDGASVTGRPMPTSRLADVTTAHAMTVHRSQGSQFDEVTVLLPEEDSRILTRELFYTALTRAKSVLRIVGSEDAIRAAVRRRAQRATGLADRLRQP